MAKREDQITVRQCAAHPSEGETYGDSYYEVLTTVGTTDPKIGERLTEGAVNALMEIARVTVKGDK